MNEESAAQSLPRLSARSCIPQNNEPPSEGGAASVGHLLGLMCGDSPHLTSARVSSLDIRDPEVMRVIQRETAVYVGALTGLREAHEKRIAVIEQDHRTEVRNLQKAHAQEMEQVRLQIVQESRQSKEEGLDGNAPGSHGQIRIAQYWKGKFSTLKSKVEDQELTIKVLQQQLLDYEHMSELDVQRMQRFVAAVREGEMRERARVASLEAKLQLHSTVGNADRATDVESENEKLLEDLQLRAHIITQLHNDILEKQKAVGHLAKKDKDWAHLSKTLSTENTVLQEEVALLRSSLETRTLELEALTQCMHQQEAHIQLLHDIVKAQERKKIPERSKQDVATAHKALQEAQDMINAQLEAARNRRRQEVVIPVPEKIKIEEICIKNESPYLDTQIIRHTCEESFGRVKLEQQLSDMHHQISTVEGERDALKEHIVHLRDKLESAQILLERQNKKLNRLRSYEGWSPTTYQA